VVDLNAAVYRWKLRRAVKEGRAPASVAREFGSEPSKYKCGICGMRHRLKSSAESCCYVDDTPELPRAVEEGKTERKIYR